MRIESKVSTYQKLCWKCKISFFIVFGSEDSDITLSFTLTFLYYFVMVIRNITRNKKKYIKVYWFCITYRPKFIKWNNMISIYCPTSSNLVSNLKNTTVQKQLKYTEVLVLNCEIHEEQIYLQLYHKKEKQSFWTTNMCKVNGNTSYNVILS